MMQIELIGCTSAGKSTLLADILQANRKQELDALSSYDFVLRKFRLDWIRNHIIRMLLLNLLALPACLVTWRKNFDLLRFVIGVVLRLPASVPRIHRLKIARITLRNVGVYEIVSHYSSDEQVVVADEGTLQIAHYLFVHLTVEPNLNDLSTFIELIPLPETVVYVRPSESVLVARTLARGHHRIPDMTPANVERFIRRAVTVFDRLAQEPVLRNRVVAVENEQDSSVSQRFQAKRLPFAISFTTNSSIDRIDHERALQSKIDQSPNLL